MRVVVTGGRYYTDRKFVWHTLDGLLLRRGILFNGLTLIEGGCPTGADHFARMWIAAMQRRSTRTIEFEHISVSADWKGKGAKAGPIRNRFMLDEYEPNIGIAFPGGSGTEHMCSMLAELARRELLEFIDLRKGRPFNLEL